MKRPEADFRPEKASAGPKAPVGLAASLEADLNLKRADRLEAVFNAMSEGLVVQDATGHIYNCNPAAERILGLSRDQLMGLTSMDPRWRAVYPDGNPFPGDQHPGMVALRTGKAVRNVEMGIDATGQGRRWITINAEPLRDPVGQAPIVVCTFIDITGRKEIEFALRDSENLFRTYLEHTHDAVFVHDSSGKLTYVNTQACTSLGYARDELLGLRIWNIDLEFDELKCREAWGQVEPGKSHLLTGTHRRKDGSTFPVEVQFCCFQWSGERQFLGYVRDVTDRRQLEEERRLAQERLKRIGENLPNGYIFQVARAPGKTSRFSYISAGARKVHGVEPEAILHDPNLLFGLLLDSDRAAMAEAEDESYGDLTDFTIELQIRSKEGRLRWLQLNSSPHREADGTVVWDGVALDITARKEADAERILRDKLESTGILAGGIAHDFNNLLTVILLNLGLVKAETLDNASVAAHLADAVKAVSSARQLTDELITSSSGGNARRQSQALEPILSTSVQTAIRQSNLVVSISIAPDLWAAEIDSNQIGRLMGNLLANAGEAMDGGGQVVIRAINETNPTDAVPPLPPGNYVRLSVTDSGRGIAPAIRSKIFDPYFSTKRRGEQKGMGLGLTISRSIAESHGGRITVETKVGGGSTFHVLLPAFNVPVPESSAELKLTAKEHHHILVVDENSTLNSVMKLVLEGEGHEVALATNGEEAVTIARAAAESGRPFRLTFLDLTMSQGMGGMETLAALRAVDPAILAVAMSGYSDNSNLQRWQQSGFNEALAKPFDGLTLRSVLERIRPS